MTLIIADLGLVIAGFGSGVALMAILNARQRAQAIKFLSERQSVNNRVTIPPRVHVPPPPTKEASR